MAVSPHPVVIGAGVGVGAGVLLAAHTGQDLLMGAVLVAMTGAAGMVVGTLFLPIY